MAISTAIGWMKRVDETGSVEPSQIGGYKPKATEASMRSGCRNGSKTAISPYAGSLPSLPDADFVHAEKLSFKKSVAAGERDGPEVALRRAA